MFWSFLLSSKHLAKIIINIIWIMRVEMSILRGKNIQFNYFLKNINIFNKFHLDIFTKNLERNKIKELKTKENIAKWFSDLDRLLSKTFSFFQYSCLSKISATSRSVL